MTAAADWTAWTCLVRVVVTDPAALDEARQILTRELATVDAACSRFRDDSELAAVESAAGRWTPVSPMLFDLLAVAIAAAESTNGDVDPTVGASLVGLGYDRDLAEIDDSKTLSPMPAAGWRTVDLDEEQHRARVTPGVRIDLGATAKARTADRAATEIARRTGSGCLVSIGGDIAVAGAPPAPGWRVRVEDVAGHPDDGPAGLSTVVRIRQGGLATSSISARRWQRGGLALHHLLDPRTGLPPRPVWRTVSAVARSCVAANTVTTAAVVRGQQAWPGIRSAAVPVRLVSVEGDVHTLGGWPEERHQ